MRTFHLRFLLGFTAITLHCHGCQTETLGDGTLRGSLPSDWAESIHRGDALLRIQEENVPIPLDLWIHEAPAGMTPTLSGWTRTGEAVAQGPELPYPVGHPNHGEVFQRQVIYYVGRVGDRVLQATVDARFDQDEVRQFLNSLEPAGIL